MRELVAAGCLAAACAVCIARARRRAARLSRSRPIARTPADGAGSLAGKRALVTGANQGIGRVVAIELGRRGCAVAVNYRSADEAEAARAVVREIEAVAGATGATDAVIALMADVSRSDEVLAMFEALDEWARRARGEDGPSIDLLVNNAAAQAWAPLLELTESDWDRVINTNAKGCLLCTQHAAKRMGGRGGRIVNIGSGCVRAPFPCLASYAASKAAIESLTKVAATCVCAYPQSRVLLPGGWEIVRRS